ncbi:MAG: hypothetical protein V1887_00695 [Candidatus Aenigmatarchaeota archaeon]
MGLNYAILMTMQVITVMILIFGGYASHNNWMYLFAVLVVVAMVGSARLMGYVRSSTNG